MSSITMSTSRGKGYGLEFTAKGMLGCATFLDLLSYGTFQEQRLKYILSVDWEMIVDSGSCQKGKRKAKIYSSVGANKPYYSLGAKSLGKRKHHTPKDTWDLAILHQANKHSGRHKE